MLNCQKNNFDLEPGVHYLNGAYMSPLSNRVEAAGLEAVSRKKRPYLITPEDFFTDVKRLKSLFAQLVNAPKAEQIALIPSASYGIATVAKNLSTHSGQNIVVLDAQFPSNLYSWRELAKERQLQITTVAYPAELTEHRGAEWNQRVLESIDRQTVMVTMAHVHWANGSRFDLAAISARCKEVGAKLVIDGTQSVGALPFDVQALGVDALICAGYKWLMGPYALGYAYFSETFQDGKPLEENWIARKNAEDFRGLVDYQDEYQHGATRYDMGEKSNFIHVPMAIEALSQLLDWGIDNIQAYCQQLTAQAVDTWRQHGYWVEDPQWRGGHLFGIQVPAGMPAESLLNCLKERQVFVSVRGDFVRISPNVYNDAADIEVLTEVLVGMK
jgi:selenocysteine lyase/cysteine desulfurase